MPRRAWSALWLAHLLLAATALAPPPVSASGGPAAWQAAGQSQHAGQAPHRPPPQAHGQPTATGAVPAAPAPPGAPPSTRTEFGCPRDPVFDDPWVRDNVVLSYAAEIMDGLGGQVARQMAIFAAAAALGLGYEHAPLRCIGHIGGRPHWRPAGCAGVAPRDAAAMARAAAFVALPRTAAANNTSGWRVARLLPGSWRLLAGEAQQALRLREPTVVRVEMVNRIMQECPDLFSHVPAWRPRGARPQRGAAAAAAAPAAAADRPERGGGGGGGGYWLLTRRRSARIAVHMRRGDVTGAIAARRGIATNFYLNVVTNVTAALERLGVEYTVEWFTEPGRSAEEEADLARIAAAVPHASLQLGADSLWNWQQMATADVLVMSKSAYSLVPALANPDALIIRPPPAAPCGRCYPSHWVIAADDAGALPPGALGALERRFAAPAAARAPPRRRRSTPLVRAAEGACPYAAQAQADAADAPLDLGDLDLDGHIQRQLLQAATFNADAVNKLDWAGLKADISTLLVTSQPFWPADNGHYGGLMIRQAWHCSGSYRTWDGRGGCNGGRIRFFPERGWDDNTNLDKAQRLLKPIKDKYGAGLSWGDLISYAGTVAIESMGGPVLGFCAGRIDDVDGTASLPLGPTKEQQEIAPCTRGDGMCEQPLGQTTMGLIYVNPEGPLANPDPKLSAPQIRGTFGRMGMNDSETVALIGGGHAFGKVHGACPTGAGPGPKEQPDNPWPGTCGSGPEKGRGPNTFTSGFEGSWTTLPTTWTNQYFRNLLDFDWEKHKGPGGHWQWKPVKRKSGTGPLPDIMMLTADIALLEDPSYLSLVKKYAADIGALETAFSSAWYKLLTRNLGPHARCLGPLTPPPQPWQHTLPAPASPPPKWDDVKADVRAALRGASAAVPASATDATPQGAYNGALFVALAAACAGTYRATDFAGGCNGARIRYSPEKDWPANKGLDRALEVLAPIKGRYQNRNLSWADLIVLAGTIALDDASGGAVTARLTGRFCPGRTDAPDGAGSEALAPRNYSSDAIALRDNAAVAGLRPREAVALAGALRSPTLQRARGYTSSWAPPGADVSKLDNSFFKALLGTTWTASKSASGVPEFVPASGAKAGGVMTPADVAMKRDPAFAAAVGEFAASNDKFLAALGDAWTKLMNADRFKGPAGSVCK
ncbi:katG [Scenedesmus sp. PABB004]|nr:katG [Scenedesmus sp. PABB004]